MEKDLQTALKSHRRLRRYGGKTTSLSKKTASIKRGMVKNLFSISLLQPQERLLGDQGRGEDPFLPTSGRKKLAEAVPPGKRPGRRKQETVYLYTKNTFSE
jgi:hypothetical protein